MIRILMLVATVGALAFGAAACGGGDIVPAEPAAAPPATTEAAPPPATTEEAPATAEETQPPATTEAPDPCAVESLPL